MKSGLAVCAISALLMTEPVDAACLVASSGRIHCVGHTLTTPGVNQDGEAARSVSRTQSFSDGTPIHAVVSSNSTIGGAGLALTQGTAGRRAHRSITLINRGVIASQAQAHTVELDGTGGTIRYKGNGEVTDASAGAGILARNGGDIRIVADGPVTAGSPRLRIRDGLSSPTPAGIKAVDYGAGSITVGGSGPVRAPDGRGISVAETPQGFGSVLVTGSGNVASHGTICPAGADLATEVAVGKTGCSGIRAFDENPASASPVVVDRSGNVKGTAAAIHAATAGFGNVKVVTGKNAIIIGRSEFGIETESLGAGSIAITTGGNEDLRSGGDGIFAVNRSTKIPSSAQSSIRVEAKGTITAAYGHLPIVNDVNPTGVLAGITAGYTGRPNAELTSAVTGRVVVNDTATIRSLTGDGIQAFDFGVGPVDVIIKAPAGRPSGSAERTDASAGPSTVVNGGGSGHAAVAAQTSAGAITVTVGNGTTIHGERGADGIDASGTGATITNRGTIEAPVALNLTGMRGASTIDQRGGKIVGDVQLSSLGDVLNISGGTIAGDITGGSGAGTVNIDTGSRRFSTDGPIDVSAVNVVTGTLRLRDNISALNAVTNAATLEIAPSAQPTITGNYRQTQAGTLVLGLDPGAAAQLTVTGRARLAGGLALSFAPGIYGARTYRLLTADHVSGGFSSLSTSLDFAFLDPRLKVSAGNVDLVLAPNGPFSSVAVTPNQASTANAVQAGGSAALVPLLTSETIAGARQAFDALSGEVYASTNTAEIEDGRIVRDAILDHMDKARALAGSSPTTQPYELWGQGLGSFGRNWSTGNAATLGRSLSGFALGADAPLGGSLTRWRLGFAGSFTEDGVSLNDRASTGSLRTTQGIVYAGAQYGRIDVRLGAAAGGSSTDTTRAVAFPGLFESERSHQDGHLVQSFGEVGWRSVFGPLTLEPSVAGSAFHTHQGGFAEDGVLAGLVGRQLDETLGSGSLGLRAELVPFADVPLVAKAYLGWEHSFGTLVPLASLQLGEASPRFTVSGDPIDRDGLNVRAGLDWRINSNTRIGAAYTGQFGARSLDQGLSGSLDYLF